MYNTYNDRSYKWTEFYPTEKELVKAISEIDADKFKTMTNQFMVKGVDYISSFVRTLNSGNDLSPAQIRQAKRLAKQVKIYHETKHLIKDKSS